MLIREYRITLPMTVEEYQVNINYSLGGQGLGCFGGWKTNALRLMLKLLTSGGTAVFSSRGLQK